MDFDERIQMMIQHDRDADRMTEEKRILQCRLRTHSKNRKTKHNMSKLSRRRNR